MRGFHGLDVPKVRAAKEPDPIKEMEFSGGTTEAELEEYTEKWSHKHEGETYDADILDEAIVGRAHHKIEIHVRADSTPEATFASVFLWHSGRWHSGEGDVLMYMCGYDDCRQPIDSEMVPDPINLVALHERGLTRAEVFKIAQNHILFCPSCGHKEHKGAQVSSPEMAGFQPNKDMTEFVPDRKYLHIRDKFTGRTYPTLKSGTYLKGTVTMIASELARLFDSLERNADLMLVRPRFTIKRDTWGNPLPVEARGHEEDRYRQSIYLRERILEDIASGAGLGHCFASFLR